MKGILLGLTERGAETDPLQHDRRLRGRTYAIPFEDVWQAATQLTGGGLRGWSIVHADDQAGVIDAVSTALALGPECEVRVRVSLDDNAQTRVDVSSASREDRADLGRNRRVIGRFFRRLDKGLRAGPGTILDATRGPAWTDVP